MNKKETPGAAECLIIFLKVIGSLTDPVLDLAKSHPTEKNMARERKYIAIHKRAVSHIGSLSDILDEIHALIEEDHQEIKRAVTRADEGL